MQDGSPDASGARTYRKLIEAEIGRLAALTPDMSAEERNRPTELGTRSWMRGAQVIGPQQQA